jgi:3-hydroxybutyryl-CoA dehydrogenase
MKVAIIGAGTMGSGIAQVVLKAGHELTLVSESEESVFKGSERVRAGFEKAIAKGKMTAEERDDALKRMKTAVSIEGAKDAELVIEAVPETLKTKSDVLVNAEGYLSENALMATNTSSLSINKLASYLAKPERFIGMHFFNPAPVMKVVEVVTGDKTSEDTKKKANEFIEGLGKTAVDVKDSPGFISNRLLMIYINEAINSFAEGIATKEAIDTIAKLGFNHPMGPFELADFIGLDVCKDIMEAIYMQSGDKRFEPSSLLVRLVNEGKLGRKNGHGFYDYKG